MKTPPDSQSQLVIHEYPFFLWMFGLIFGGGGLSIVFDNQDTMLLGMLFVGMGLFILLWLAAIVTITVDKSGGTLTIVSQSVLRRGYKEFEIKDIAGIEVESRASRSSRGGSSTVYGVQLLLANGQREDLSSFYSSGRAGKEHTAQKLRDILGILDAESTRAKILGASQASRPEFQPANPQQEAGAAWLADLSARQADEPATQTTSGVSWRLVDQAGDPDRFSGFALLRWFSPDFKLPDGFLYIVQKPKGSPALGTHGLLGGISMVLYRQSLRLFGFGEEHTPGLEQAEMLQPLDPRLEPYYFALTNDNYAARQVLNPWTTIPLAQWAERYPLKQIQSAAQAGQLAVLFSPLGTYVTCIGPNPAQRDALTDLGVEMVKAQGG